MRPFMGGKHPTRKLDFRTSRKCLLTLFISCIRLVLIVFPQLSCPVHFSILELSRIKFDNFHMRFLS